MTQFCTSLNDLNRESNKNNELVNQNKEILNDFAIDQSKKDNENVVIDQNKSSFWINFSENNKVVNQNMSCSTPIEKSGNALSINLDLNKDNSLIEFEENEKKVADMVNESSENSASSNSIDQTIDFKSSINQMEHILSLLKNKNKMKSIHMNANNKSNNNDTSMEIAEEIIDVKSESGKAAFPNAYIRKSDHLLALESKLENEILKRQHCEKQIIDLNETILELQEELAVANGLEKKHEHFIQNIEASLKNIIEEWKQKETSIETRLNQMKLEKQRDVKNELELKMKNDFLEKEVQKTNQDLINEKVKCQEYSNEIMHLKNQLVELDKSSAKKDLTLNENQTKIDKLESELNNQTTKVKELNAKILNIEKESEKLQSNSTNQINELKKSSQNLNKQYEKLKIEYENLINEAKLVVEESEKQHNELYKTIENERMKKDSLQVEINLLEEKLENVVKSLTNDYENKINKIKQLASEKEKSLNETLKVEIEQINVKNKMEIDKLKTKYFDELQSCSSGYETKLTDLNLKIDSLRKEIDRLNRTNKDLENERNTIRQNLKQMLELQMKETMQLLGINVPLNTENDSLLSKNNNDNVTSSIQNQLTLKSNLSKLESIENILSNNCSTKTSVDEKNSNEIDNFHQIGLIKTSSPKLGQTKFNFHNLENSNNSNNFSVIKFDSGLNNNDKNVLGSSSIDEIIATVKNKIMIDRDPNDDSFNLSLKHKEQKLVPDQQKINTPVSDSTLTNSTILTQARENVKVKDSFILSQIDLINKYYQIDNSTIAAAVKVKQTSSSINDLNSMDSNKNIANYANKKNSSLDSNMSFAGRSALTTSCSHTALNSNRKANQIQNQEPNNSNFDPSRATELRHFIEILLNRSPTSSNEQKKFLNLNTNNYAQSTPQSNEKLKPNMVNMVKPKPNIAYQNDVNSSIEYENENEKQNSDLKDKNDLNKNKKFSSKHDLSDLELGYNKRYPCEYYDDVKRTLNFDDDDEDDNDDDDIEFDEDENLISNSISDLKLVENNLVAKKNTNKNRSSSTNLASNNIKMSGFSSNNMKKGLNPSLSVSLSSISSNINNNSKKQTQSKNLASRKSIMTEKKINNKNPKISNDNKHKTNATSNLNLNQNIPKNDQSKDKSTTSLKSTCATSFSNSKRKWK